MKKEWNYEEVPVYRVRRFGFKAFPKRSEKDVILGEYDRLKDAQKEAVKLNSSKDSQLYDTRWYVDEVAKVRKTEVK